VPASPPVVPMMPADTPNAAEMGDAMAGAPVMNGGSRS